FNNEVLAIWAYNNEIYACGRFTMSGTDPMNRIARWNGAAWTTLGTGLNEHAHAMRIYANELVVGGAFTSAGGVGANRIAKWNGSVWSTLGLGMNDEVYALIIYNTDLYAAGPFTQVGGIGVNRIARWNGSWSNLGLGTNGYVSALTVYGGNLVAGGVFTTAGGLAANRIANWNGSAWSNPYGGGLTGGGNVVNTLTSYTSGLFPGGSFTSADITIVSNVARWGFPVAINEISNIIPDEYKLYQNYPNPFNPSTKIRFSIPPSEGVTGRIVRLDIYNILGKEIDALVNEELNPGTYEVEWNAANYPSGVYYYKLTAGDYSDTKNMILVK
ncbi:MAG TPA: T9SS type A sorting domain-containing protein, partial [Ignavibacteria bacterium]